VIAWWGWLLIWTGLVLALLGLVAFFAWRHIRRFFALLEDFFALTGKLAVLDTTTSGPEARATNAVLEQSEVVRREFGARMDRRRSMKEARRQARVQRAKMITTADIAPHVFTTRHHNSRE
jgi:hypothetical protein